MRLYKCMVEYFGSNVSIYIICLSTVLLSSLCSIYILCGKLKAVIEHNNVLQQYINSNRTSLEDYFMFKLLICAPPHYEDISIHLNSLGLSSRFYTVLLIVFYTPEDGRCYKSPDYLMNNYDTCISKMNEYLDTKEGLKGRSVYIGTGKVATLIASHIETTNSQINTLINGIKPFVFANTIILCSKNVNDPLRINECLVQLEKCLHTRNCSNKKSPPSGEPFEPGVGSSGEMLFNDEYRGLKYNTLIDKVKDYVHNNYSKEITLEVVSENVYLSKFHLSRIFKRETGQTFYNYLINVRIGKAESLLTDTNLKIKDIAEKVGYINAKSFTKIFKDVTGITPVQFREKSHINKHL